MRSPKGDPAATTGSGAEQDSFHVAARYWPARTGLYWWESFCADEARRDWERAGQFGLSRFLIVLTRQDFQPDRQRVPAACLRNLETADPGFLSRGLLHADGSPKDAARVWCQWSLDHPVTRTVPADLPDVDREQWRSRPGHTVRELYEELGS